ncbi:MAG: glutamine-hydrolyzing carbamoyl-phosphate synthase small subunit [Syntrophomonadaceae bacterium]|nr:glutamine-hydrolyzing carbamoyl-phosphate synthase small subunit [Syntrophomonadaceae bacterium]
MKGYLVLENGRIFTGKLLNNCSLAGGEVVFTTASISYQDIITDPSYYGQIVVMTYPLVGNVGFNEKSFASSGAMVQGLILRELTDFPSHWEMETDIISFLNKYEVAVLTEVDTRAVTRVIRNHANMGGVITDNLEDRTWLLERARHASQGLRGDLVQYVTRKNLVKFGHGSKRVVILDLGMKRGVFESFISRDCEVLAAPADTSAADMLTLKPDGIFLSDGPGDPQAVPYAIATTRRLMGQVPLFGVGLGHQILALAMGAEVHKMEHGHRGSNHPVRNLANNRVYITTQNHGFAIDDLSLASTDIEVTMRSLNDHSIEGIKHRHLPVFSLQFDPEGYPGYSDTGVFFAQFIDSL